MVGNGAFDSSKVALAAAPPFKGGSDRLAICFAFFFYLCETAVGWIAVDLSQQYVKISMCMDKWTRACISLENSIGNQSTPDYPHHIIYSIMAVGGGVKTNGIVHL